MTTHHASTKGGLAVSKLVGATLAAGAVLFVAPAGVALADTGTNDPLGSIGRNLTSAGNQAGRDLQSTVRSIGGIGQGNVNGSGGIGQGNVDNLGGILQGNVDNFGLILQGLAGSFQSNGGSSAP